MKEMKNKAAPAAVSVPDERAAFDQWLMKELDAINWDRRLKDLYFARRDDGNYVQQATRERWEAWQAGRAALAATPAQSMVLPEPLAFYDGNKWYADEAAAICACADLPKLQKVYTEQQVRALLATGGQVREELPQAEGADYFVILDPEDGTVEFAYSADLGRDFGHEHIKDAQESDNESAHCWVVRPAYAAPQQAEARDAEQERWMEIGKAIERACIDQPDSTEIVISLERDAGTVTMFDPDGNEHDQFSHEDGFAGVVNAAIEAAIAAAKGKQ